MLLSAGSADCAQEARPLGKPAPSMDAWLNEAKASPNASKIGMYLTHSGTVRETAKAAVRNGDEAAVPVKGMQFSYDAAKVSAAVKDTYRLDGIYYVKAWLNAGTLQVGDDIMRVLIGGDIRPHVVDALQYLVGRLKEECVTETELH
ncbi:molybdenum cofactor biosynthesis protein MoaE [Dysosmobacter sp. Sow4_B12]|uniref:molybdenum cofactor biosynthesis protein MoaE n=1 Tax=Dysosmobacter sp. Sow4_B12 TaxID=3438777 RepID=UPI003F91EBAB